MSQRLQSIFFFLSALLFALLFFLPLAEFDAEQINLFFYVYGMESKTPNGVIPFSKMFSIPVLVLAITAMLLAGYLAMSLFRAVKLSQFVKLHGIARASIIVTVAWIALVFAFYIPTTEKALVGLNGVFYKPGVFLPLVALILLIAATSGLRKDIKKVRSTDRIR
jgi:hypothetical protein